jgi:hypothetical protein
MERSETTTRSVTAVRRIVRCRNEKGGLKTAAFAGVKHLEALHDAAADQHFSVNVNLA